MKEDFERDHLHNLIERLPPGERERVRIFVESLIAFRQEQRRPPSEWRESKKPMLAEALETLRRL